MHSPPTVADAKLKFTTAFKKPLPAIYSTVVQVRWCLRGRACKRLPAVEGSTLLALCCPPAQELLVQQHLFRWNAQYQYNEVRTQAQNMRIWQCSQGAAIMKAQHGLGAACPGPLALRKRPAYSACRHLSMASAPRPSPGAPPYVQVTALGIISILEQITEQCLTSAFCSVPPLLSGHRPGHRVHL